MQNPLILKKMQLDTPLGSMLAIADEKALYLLEFVDCVDLAREIACLGQKMILAGYTAPIRSIKNELKQYFSGQLHVFKTPFHFVGTPFQQRVWEALRKIPFGTTCSYSDLACAVDKPTACRAVAGANGANLLPIIVPCHRVINKNGDWGGYNGGLARKKWLLNHEKSYFK